MRIPTGTTDQYLYFIAVDATDGVTPETGFGGSGWTVYRTRNGGTATAYTTPTITELDSSNMPGWYALLLDEDMTIGSGNDSEEVALHITHSGMLPARLVFELYRREVSDGQTLTVSGGNGNAAVQSIANNAITANSIASAALTSAKFASGAFDAVWSVATRLLTAGTNIVLAKGTGVTGFTDLSQADVRSAVGLSSANLDTQLSTIDTVVDAILVDTDSTIPSTLSTIDGKIDTIDTVVDAILVDTDSTIPSTLSTINGKIDIIDGVVDDILVDTGTTLPSTLAIIDGVVDDILVDTGTTLPGSISTLDGKVVTVDSVVDAIKLKTDSLTFSETGIVDANIQYVNSVEIQGDGSPGTEWGPA